MLKDKFHNLCELAAQNKKIVFPAAIVVAAAITVSTALGASGGRKLEEIVPESEAAGQEESEQVELVPLVKNEDSAISELIYTYYDAQANGNLEVLETLRDEMSEVERLSYQEKANYYEYYPKLEIYTKKGLNEGETIVYVYYWLTFVNHEEAFPGYTSHYVCTAEDGSLYIKFNNFSDELNEYTRAVCAQDDVVEFNNRVKAEYDLFKEEHPDLADYPDEVKNQVNINVGIKWSEMQAQMESVSEGNAAEQTPEESQEQTPEEEGPKFATATTTVNVRSSDSEQADKLGKVSGGTRVEVLEQQINGWTQIVYEGAAGYIKSEFLQMEESASGVASIGTVKATTNVNVRASASETGTKLGTLVGGDTAELIALEGDWCKIKFDGQIAYVKAEFVEEQ